MKITSTVLIIFFTTLTVGILCGDDGNQNLPFTAPADTGSFHPVFHFPPVNQDTTNSCWSFATTSFIESEVQRIHGRRLKLSVMFSVYHAFLEKARVFVESRGDSRFMPGDLFPMVIEVVRNRGAVPEAVYQGRANGRKTYNHRQMEQDIETLKSEIIQDQKWDQQWVQTRVKAILDKYLGPAPESFVFENKTYTPEQFARERIDLDWEDYLLVTSFSYAPFNTYTMLTVPDNWKKIDRYFNVPLDLFYRSMKDALETGYSLAMNGDIGEPGRMGAWDIAYIPDYDIPADFISQKARDYRFDKGITTDDHLMHIVGYTSLDDNDWFLVKDSWRDAFEGRQKGYFFYHGDFVRLKVLAFLVHRDGVPEISALAEYK